MPNRMGLGMRPYGQGPSIATLAQQQQHMQPHFVNAQASRTTTLFVGSISGGITDAHLNEMLGVCPFPYAISEQSLIPSFRHAVL